MLESLFHEKTQADTINKDEMEYVSGFNSFHLNRTAISYTHFNEHFNTSPKAINSNKHFFMQKPRYDSHKQVQSKKRPDKLKYSDNIPRQLDFKISKGPFKRVKKRIRCDISIGLYSTVKKYN
ncbi:hypothetical protein AVEN_217804-1 [Araneus ventricosus]|uniref:Uncharacterized protein n=1 Tax=Araneus ventricosus TaxID=182803 RepID=A0A4Y2HFE4_ARAVE|nr:hypothetical protein AVEN_217804-1 [Araneus ventricosus]